MNIFVLSQNPYEAARDHCDKHTVKMVLEYAQMLSTTHRLLDGHQVLVSDSQNRVKPKKMWLLGGESARVAEVHDDEGFTRHKWVVDNAQCYLVAHANHPCSVWARETDANYYWLYQLLDGCLKEFERRYHKPHSTSRLVEFLSRAPRRIRRGQLTPYAQAMPEEYKHEDAVEAYRRFYTGSKARFAKWKNTPVPDWFKHRLEGQNATHLSGTPQLD